MKFIHHIAAASVLLSVGAFAQDPLPYKTAELCPTSVNSVGKGAVLSFVGAARAHPAVAIVSGGPSGLCGSLLYGPVVAEPPVPWGDGRLCIAPFHPNNGRFRVCGLSPDGNVRIPLEEIYSGQVYPFEFGETGYFQFVYRDKQDWNLSNAVTVVHGL